ncbi:MAG TPA: GNAT family N-acetyltransferase [Gaiellaceae bacterium]|nr:GNAT family N-acetyltransferase [Gaiellaceae bacterium]
MLRIERHVDVTAFYERVSPFLLRQEAVHCVQLGFRETLEANPHAFGDADPDLLAATEDDEVVGVATRTPPHNLMLSLMEDRVSTAFADEFRGVELPGVIAPSAVGAMFVSRLSRNAVVALEERLFETTEVVPPPRPTSGRLRWYEDGDRELLVAWLTAFHAEAMPGEHVYDAEQVLERRGGGHGEFAFWDDAGPVSFAGFGSPTPNGMRIGPVYTPPELRGRGYASALTAAVTEHVFAGGRRFCFLATDLANPTSNSIYQRIGYRPVTDVTVWRFEDAAG